MFLRLWYVATILVAITALMGCSSSPTSNVEDKASKIVGGSEKRFRLLKPEETGIKFTNYLKEDGELNYMSYEYIYNGGGVAIGDVNNDGLVDIYFTGNQASDRLYLNKGDLKFEDVTKAMNISANGWRTGVTMADVNSDGFIDIFVCRSGIGTEPDGLRDLLYVNQNGESFKEQGAEYGINATINSTQSAFLDFDNDGDLDLYVMGHPIDFHGAINSLELQKLKEERVASDVLYRNDNGYFTDISKSAGIMDYSFGLGLSVSDLNGDGFSDIYVSNDYDEPDILYMNMGDGTFVDQSPKYMKHMANFGMGTDISDVNGDGFMDMFTVDMAFETHQRSKMNMESMSNEKFWLRVKLGFHYQYMHNNLHINHGNGYFSEVAQAVGLSRSDWSWAPLWMDMNNSGQVDLFITNGFRRELKDNDTRQKLQEFDGSNMNMNEYYELFPVKKLKNYVFQNHGGLEFEKVSDEWGFDLPTHSNGASYGDLDNDGDLDLVINGLDETSLIYENTSPKNSDSHWISVDLNGRSGNTIGIGSKITVSSSEGDQVKEMQLTRGYQSSVEPRVHFGLGKVKTVDVTVDWPTGERSVMKNVQADQLLSVDQSEATDRTPDLNSDGDLMFTEIAANSGIDHKHAEMIYDDFIAEVLLPHKQSQHGPFVAVGDMNGDGLEDAFIGGAKDQTGGLFLQGKNGSFAQKNSTALTTDRSSEDLGAVMFDADGDGDLDLYVSSGGVEFSENSPSYQDRLYLNDGNAGLTKSTGLPQMLTSTSAVSVDDFDGDGDLDLFVGGRNVPGKYPFRPRSYVLQNNNGEFTDVTDQIAPDLKHAGMVTSLQFGDIDGDSDNDLVVTGEWMPMTIYYNEDGNFTLSNNITLDNTEGWWYSAALGDLDGDGDLDIVAGNLGKNNKFHPKEDHPLHIYCNDFDENGTYDIVLAKYQGEICFPVRGRECSSQQMPFIVEKFPTFKEFANADVERVYGKDLLDQSLHLVAKDMRSHVFLNDGSGSFERIPLPIYAQIAPLNAIQLMDIDSDGDLDLIGGGNMHTAEVETTRYDAGVGLCMLNDGHGSFTNVPVSQSGLFIDGNVKDVKLIEMAGGGKALVVANNDGPVQLIRIDLDKGMNGVVSSR